MTEKVRQRKKILDERGLDIEIEVDGGVDLGNLEELILAGATVLVSGSKIFKGDAAANVRAFKAIMNQHED